jgi:hypothetical protein
MTKTSFIPLSHPKHEHLKGFVQDYLQFDHIMNGLTPTGDCQISNTIHFYLTYKTAEYLYSFCPMIAAVVIFYTAHEGLTEDSHSLIH